MRYSNILSYLQKNFPAMVSGLLLTLSFPNTQWYFLSFIALVPWMISFHSLTPRQAAVSGFTFGLMHFVSLIYWIVPTVHIYGSIHIILAVSTLILLCFYLSLYPAVFAWIMKKTSCRDMAAPFLSAALWCGLEFLRAHAFTGFAWGALGYSQFSNLLLIQIADFSGVFGVSFLIVFVNYSFVLAWFVVKHQRPQNRLICLFFSAVLISSACFYGYLRIQAVNRQINAAPKPGIALIQGNIRQDVKWSNEFKNRTVEKYIRLSESLSKKNPQLVIWPETALPFYYGFDEKLSGRVDKSVRKTQTNYLIGSPAFERENNRIYYYNRAIMLNRFSLKTGVYDKTHLVPFGEYVPFGDYLTFLGKITEHAGNFSRGDDEFTPLKFNGHQTGVLICFEILFPGIAAEFVKNGADMLTTMTNDAWFGTTSAARQHFSIAVFRAVENRRSLARVANTGISGFIDPVGHIFNATDLFTDQAVYKKMPMLKTITFYTQHADLFAWTCILAFCIGFMLKKRHP